MLLRRNLARTHGGWNKRIFDMWLACYEQKEIAEAVGETPARVNQIVADLPKLDSLAKSDQSSADHATDFTPPIYNIWKQQEKTHGGRAPDCDALTGPPLRCAKFRIFRLPQSPTIDVDAPGRVNSQDTTKMR